MVSHSFFLSYLGSMPQHFKTLSELHRACHIPGPEFSQLSIFDFDAPVTTFSDYLSSFTGDFYMISLKKIQSGILLYGRTPYDHQCGTMSFMKPGQLVELKNVKWEENGFVIAFHQDFIQGHALLGQIHTYGFFDYEVNEALHLSDKESGIMWELYRKIQREYSNNEDEFSKSIILTHVDAILQYANRYYRRQFINRATPDSLLLSRFKNVLAAFIQQGNSLPAVTAVATELGISPKYLSDLLRHHTGKTTIELIHDALIDEARTLLLDPERSVAEAAYSLGFEHPTYFSRLFRKKTGLSPTEYRRQHSN